MIFHYRRHTGFPGGVQLLSEHDYAQAQRRGIKGEPFGTIMSDSFEAAMDHLTMLAHEQCPVCGRKD